MDPTISRRALLATSGVTLVNAAAGGAIASQEEREDRREHEEPVREATLIVELDGEELAGVRTITLPSFSAEPEQNREGNDADYEKKTWGQPTFDDLKMERGFDPESTELYDWIKDIQAGKVDNGRKEITIKLLGEQGEMELQWELRKAWITEYSPPELDASADDDVATESITVAFDKYMREEV